jgi:hypothetical protein
MRAAAVALAASLLTGLNLGVAGSQASPAGGVPVAVTANPLDVQMAVTPSTAGVGATLKAVATVTNLSALPLVNAVARLRVDAANVAIKGSETIVIGKLAARHRAQVTWQICARRPGGYVAVAQANGSYADGRAFAAESAAATFAATTSKKACR